MDKRNHVFVSYSHKDEKWLERLRVHLRPLTREHKLDLWDDSRIQPSSNWRSEIQLAIDKASVAILFISADFLASDFVHENELPPLLKKAENDGLLIFPVIISPCRFAETKNISQFQAINDPSRPLISQGTTKREKVFWELSKHIEKSFFEIIPEEVENEVSDLGGEKEIINENPNAVATEVDSQEFTHISPISVSVINKIMESAKKEIALTGLSTGLRELDYFTSGLQPSELILIAAKPYMGLSAFAQTIALNSAVYENRTIALFSIASAKEKIVNQMICGEARVDGSRLNNAYITRAEWVRVSQALQTLEESQIFIDDRHELSIQQMQVVLRKLLTDQKKLDLVIVDDLQYLTASQKTKANYCETSQLTYELKGLAKEFKIPVIALCQLPPDSGLRYKARPMLSDLSELGSIEQFVDVSILIHREEFYHPTDENKGIAEIEVTKHGSGIAEMISFAFIKEFNRFENYFGT
ncbi:MAG: DnaB-like helicase C-terminal domain-containing protein [Pyrinomonadaceae bacterium]